MLKGAKMNYLFILKLLEYNELTFDIKITMI